MSPRAIFPTSGHLTEQLDSGPRVLSEKAFCTHVSAGPARNQIPEDSATLGVETFR